MAKKAKAKAKRKKKARPYFEAEASVSTAEDDVSDDDADVDDLFDELDHVWFSIRVRDEVPDGVKTVLVPAPAGWDFPLTLQRERGLYKPTGAGKERDATERLQFVPDVRRYRLTREQYDALMEVLRKRTMRSVGIPTLEYELADLDRIAEPNPTLFELVEVMPGEQPQRWRDCWYDEHWMLLASPVKTEEAPAVTVRSPAAPSEIKQADMLLAAFVKSDDSTIDAANAAREHVTKALAS